MNYDLFKQLNLQPGEKVVKTYRRHYLYYIPRTAFSFIIILLPFFLLHPLVFHLQKWGLLIFGILFLTGSVLLARYIIIWNFDSITLTNKRLIDIDQKGLFNRAVSEAMLDKVQDITYSQKGFFATISNYGTIKITTASVREVIELPNVHNPRQAQIFITQYLEQNIKGLKLNKDASDACMLEESKLENSDNSTNKSKEEFFNEYESSLNSEEIQYENEEQEDAVKLLDSLDSKDAKNIISDLQKEVGEKKFLKILKKYI